jgi:uncharacterized protein YecE (DUF72 family)
MATKRFEPDDMAAFLALLPASHDGLPLRHAIEPRHESFRDPAFFEMAREAGVAVVLADADDHPQFTEQTAGFTYARLQSARDKVKTGYTQAELGEWAVKLEALSASGRDVFAFFIDGAKHRAPAAAEALLAQQSAGRDT